MRPIMQQLGLFFVKVLSQSIVPVTKRMLQYRYIVSRQCMKNYNILWFCLTGIVSSLQLYENLSQTRSPAIARKSRPYRLGPKPSVRLPVTERKRLSEVTQFHARCFNETLSRKPRLTTIA